MPPPPPPTGAWGAEAPQADGGAESAPPSEGDGPPPPPPFGGPGDQGPPGMAKSALPDEERHRAACTCVRAGVRAGVRASVRACPRSHFGSSYFGSSRWANPSARYLQRGTASEAAWHRCARGAGASACAILKAAARWGGPPNRILNGPHVLWSCWSSTTGPRRQALGAYRWHRRWSTPAKASDELAKRRPLWACCGRGYDVNFAAGMGCYRCGLPRHVPARPANPPGPARPPAGRGTS